MISVFRQHQRVLMLVIAILTIIAFAWLYNPMSRGRGAGGGGGSNVAARIYNQELSQADIDRQVRNFQLALAMQQEDLIGDLGGMNQDERLGMNNFIWNLLVLQHQAGELGVEPTDGQVADLLKAMPVFQTDGQFDPRKYQAFIQDQLGPKGFTEFQLENVARDTLRLQQVKKVVTASVAVSPGEITNEMREYQKVDLQIVYFPTKDDSSVTVSDQEIQGIYQKYQSSLIAPETRSVKYVEFSLPAPAAAATDKEKVDAQQKLADSADAFAQKAGSTASLDAAAQAAGMTVKTTADFDKSGSAKPGMPPSDDLLKGLAPAVFVLGGESALSDPVLVDDKYYVVQVVKITPARPLSLDEARPMIAAQLRMMKAQEISQQKGKEQVLALHDSVAGGHSFVDAATALGLKTETVTGVEPANPPSTVPAGVARLSMWLNPAQTSGYVPSPTGDGGVAFCLVARAPLALSPAELNARRAEMAQRIIEDKKRLLFVTWLAASRDSAGIAMTQRGSQ